LFLSTAWPADGYILRTGDGETLLNGLVVKASPKTGTQQSILVEQTFQLGAKTVLHLHEQGDELFYIVSGRGTARLGETEEAIATGDVIFVPAGAIHQIKNQDHEEPLVVVFFMDRPELVDLFRAIHERVVSEPDRPITAKEIADIEERSGGGKTVN
jgi:mannose-6-phosphate isomerase-like protein (cupin superfamily)